MNKRITFTVVMILLTASTGLADLTDGLVAHYKLDGTSGAVVDETGNYDGVNYGTTRGVTGKVGNAFYFDESDYVSTDLIPSIYATASLWIYPEGPGLGLPHGGFLGTGGTTDGGKDCWSFSWSSDTEAVAIAFYEGNSVNGSIPVSNPGSVPLGVFSHIAVIVNDTNTSLYINGKLSGTGILLSSQDLHDRGLLIGRHYVTGGGASTMRGKIDEVRIYNRALTQSEIKELYNEGSEPPCPPLPSHEPWSFVQISDPHIGSYLDIIREDTRDILASAIDTITTLDTKPDFVICTGDIADSAWFEVKILGFPKRYRREVYKNYLEALEVLDDYGIEHYEVPGNHDRYVYGYGFYLIDFLYFYSLDLSHYCAWLPGWFEGGNYYSFENKDMMFIGLDSGKDVEGGFRLIVDPPDGEELRGTGLTNEQMSWLNGLEFCSPKVVFMHHPAVHTTAGEMVIANNRGGFIEYCKTNNIQLVLTGHTHESHILNAEGGGVAAGSTNYPQFIQTPSVSVEPGWIPWLSGDEPGYRIVDVVNNKTYPRAYSLTPFPLTELFYPTLTLTLLSPGNVHVYDSSDRHVGVTDSGEPERGIPRSFYFSPVHTDDGIEVLPGKIIIFNSLDDYLHKVVGTEEGTYGLVITSTSPGEETTFEAIDIPTSPGTRHVYTVNWEALSAGEEGVTLEIDADGDGIYERTIIADENLTSEEFTLQTETAIDFEPDTLNLRSPGKVVTAYIELPEGFDVSDIDVSKLKLNDSVPALLKPITIGDHDEDGIADLMVKFDRQQVIEILGSGTQMVTLTGRLSDGRPLSGIDFIRVIDGTEAEAVAPEFESTVPEGFMADMEDNLQTTTDDSVDIGGEDAFGVKEAVGFMLFEASETINELGPESFNNEESAFELACVINDVFTMLDEGMYFEVMVILDGDILERMDGYTNIGQPDGDDWVTSIEGQALLYPLVTETIELLESLL